MAQDFSISIVAGKGLRHAFANAGADARSKIRNELNSTLMLYASLEKAALSRNFTRRTGLLEHVVIQPISATAHDLEGRVGSPALYARIHELGGTVHAKNVANLTIPLPAIKTKRGVARGTARDIISNPGAYGYTSAFFKTSKAGNHILFGTKGSAITPLFVLKPEVTLPARPTWKPTLDAVEPIFRSKMASAMQSLIKQ